METKIIAIPIYGISLYDAEFIEINSKIKLINKSNLKNYMCDNLDKSIHERILEIFSSSEKGFNLRDFDTYLILELDAKINLEDVKELVKMIDDIFRFMIGGYEEKISIGSYNFRNPVDEKYIMFTPKDIKFNIETSLGEGNTFNNKLILRKDTLTNKEKGYSKLFDLVIQKNKTDLGKRIINSLNWLGQANNSVNLSNNLVYCMIALESLLNLDTSNFSASIVNQISEGVAIITAHNLEDRKKAKKSIKNLYKLRSKIAHGKDNNLVKKEEVELIYNLVKYTIEDLLYNPEYKEVKTIEDLLDILENKKLSC